MPHTTALVFLLKSGPDLEALAPSLGPAAGAVTGVCSLPVHPEPGRAVFGDGDAQEGSNVADSRGDS